MHCARLLAETEEGTMYIQGQGVFSRKGITRITTSVSQMVIAHVVHSKAALGPDLQMLLQFVEQRLRFIREHGYRYQNPRHVVTVKVTVTSRSVRVDVIFFAGIVQQWKEIVFYHARRKLSNARWTFYRGSIS